MLAQPVASRCLPPRWNRSRRHADPARARVALHGPSRGCDACAPLPPHFQRAALAAPHRAKRAHPNRVAALVARASAA
ncbi:hypothetical protein DB771_22855 [Burkholderia sp. AU29985]|nr:hypothetical protein XM57_05430 [Burkholderia cepacia]AYZ97183.1 hypothetical protein EGY28_19245 [Burkholderia dolosa]ETP66751.1 hypothetical protein BDSB_01955 [Burkholderia dolosa PC543]PRE42733.1 hypothetical protein C6P87_25965 [Burkholderia sp. AU12872]PUA74512.1 hypothetical protein DB771_22855 [Burkholderia sp. AU29985]